MILNDEVECKGMYMYVDILAKEMFSYSPSYCYS